MHTLAFLTQKGGSGKTTLALHVAVAALESGLHVGIADTDPQGSALAWRALRTEARPDVIGFDPGDLPANGYDLLIVDSAPHADFAATQIARAADVVAIPVRPDAIDLSAVAGALRIVRAAQAHTVFVLSSCPPRAPEIEETRAALAHTGFRVAPGQITERRAFARAFATGTAVTEFEADGKAAEEVRALWSFLKGQLYGKQARSKKAPRPRR